MSYFAIERNGEVWDHVNISYYNGDINFANYKDMNYDEMKSQENLGDLVVAVMEVMNAELNCDDEETILTLIGDDDIFIWSIIMGPGENDKINYVLVDWKKDEKKYRYEN